MDDEPPPPLMELAQARLSWSEPQAYSGVVAISHAGRLLAPALLYRLFGVRVASDGPPDEEAVKRAAVLHGMAIEAHFGN